MLSPRLLKDLKGRSSCSTLPLWVIQRFFVLGGRVASVVTKLIDAAVATLGGADALLFAGLGGALAVLAKHLKLDGRWCNDQARYHPPEVQGHVAALSQGQGGEHQAPSGHAQGHDHGLSPGHPAADQHHSEEVDSDDHGQHEGDECDAADAAGAIQLGLDACRALRIISLAKAAVSNEKEIKNELERPTRSRIKTTQGP